MRVLVTGGGGFLGRYIVEQLLRRGDQVRILARSDYPELQAEGVECLRGDVRDAGQVRLACRGMEAVIHTAAIAGIQVHWRPFFETNTEGTRHVVEACRGERVSRLVYCSSPSVTFAGMDQAGVDETVGYPRRWLGHYSHSKALAEQAVLAANGSTLRTCSLRPHLIWGPRDQHLIPRLLQRARAGQLRRVGAGTNRIDTIYVENAAEAHLLALDRLQDASPVAGQAYFLSQGEPVNCWEWIDQILDLAGLPPLRRAISYRAAYAIGGVLEGVYRTFGLRGEPRMTRFLAAQLATSHYFDISKARRDLGYRPRISLEEGMRRLANHWANR